MTGTPAQTKPLFVLIDDNIRSAREFEGAAQSGGSARLRWVGDAEHGLSVLSGETGSEPPDMIIVNLDHEVDRLTGLLRRLGDLPLTEDAPLLVLQSEVSEKDRLSLIAAGALDVAPTPLDPARLASELRSYAALYARRRPR